LPYEGILLEICKYFKKLENMSKESLDGTVAAVEGKPKKNLIYQFFFFNYLV
jgi:hypothetical protein